nr:hypothetical protein [uncultured Mucilaginibacter sp.]
MKKIKIFIALVIIGISAGNVFAQPQKNLGVNHSYQPVKKSKPDYVILANSNDTLFCDIKIGLISLKPSYKTFEKGAKSIKITPENVKEYYTGGKDDLYQVIFTKEEDDSIFFAKVVERGKINLFEVAVQYTTGGYGFGGGAVGGGTNTTWYISKGSNNAEPIKFSSALSSDREKRKTLLEEMVADNKDVADRYAATNKKFTFNHIKNLVHLYNTGVWND